MDYNADYADIQQTFFIWYRADRGYNWKEKVIIDDSDEPVQSLLLVENPHTTGYVGYWPLAETKLFLKFAETPPTKEGILAFANVYGKLNPVHGVFVPKKDGQSGLIFTDTLTSWQNEIHQIKQAVQIWEWLKDDNRNALRKVIVWSKDCKSVEYVVSEGLSIEVSSESKREVFARFPTGGVVLPAQHLIQILINKKLETHSIMPRLFMDDTNHLVGYLTPSSLLSAMWLQFYLAVIGEREYKRCSICGLWADTTEKRRNWNRHEECANRERVAKHRKKKREKEAAENGD